MDWWNDLTDWISSDDGWRVISGAIIPFVAIIVAGIIAALIGRGATKRVVSMQEREARNAAVAGIVSAARKAAAWGSLGHDERAYADHLAEDSDIRLRLLPVTGAPLAANWTQHEIADIKKNSSTFSFQAEQSLAEFRERLLEWQARPSKARKLFKSDLERWKFDSPDPDAELITRQQDWNADQASGARTADSSAATTPAPVAERPTPTTTSLRPAAQRPGGTPSSATSAPSGAASAPSGATSAPSASAPSASAPSASTSAPSASAPSASTSAPSGAGSAASSAAGAASAPAGAAAAQAARSGFSVTRGGSTSADQNATTPISDENASNATTPISSANTTRAYGDGATRSYGDGAGAPVRPTLGSPTSAKDTDNADTVDDTRSAGSASASGPRTGSAAPSPVATPTSADAHVNRSSDGDGGGSDAPRTPNTTSVPTRITDAPAEPADANETSEAPYTQPISASELRRRAATDDE